MMKVRIELAQGTPDKESSFEEWADETIISVDGEPSFPHLEGNLVGLLNLLDRLHTQAREHIIAQMSVATSEKVPAIIYVPDEKIYEVTKIMEKM
jgi:hypothetical protein